MTKKKTRTILEQIDELIEELKNNDTVELVSPDGKTKWRISLERRSDGYPRLQVHWQPTWSNSWKRLNPGWHVMRRTVGFENKARIIIGQILVGERQSGLTLHQLKCGYTLKDGGTGSPTWATTYW